MVHIYTLTFAVLTLGGGMLADRFGVRPVFLAGLALFTAASLVAGLASDGSLLVGMRATQGAGAVLVGVALLPFTAVIATVSARLPADLAGSAADPKGFAAGVEVGLSVYAVLALAAAALAVVTLRTRGLRSTPLSRAHGPSFVGLSAGTDSQGRA
ncbi:MAG TPA: hypothetical protein VFZ63_09630 [Jiangellaceae bacterium]